MSFFPPHFVAALTVSTFLSALAASTEDRIWFPADSGVIDVTQPPYSARPGDGVDDTAAIQQALLDHPTGNHVFYLPRGIYDISDALLQLPPEHPLHNSRACLELRGSMKRNILCGESEGGTVLRLMDSVPASFSGGVLWFGPQPAQRFRNALRHLTVSIGTGHPGAHAVLFNASNQGGVRQVTLRSEDPRKSGGIGLHLAHTGEIGPLLVQHLTIDGFDRGIACAFQTASQTFEHIQLKDQRLYGWTNGFSQSIFIRGLHYQGPSTALRNGPTLPGDPGQGRILLLEASLRHTGSQSPPPAAIRNQKSAFLRDVHAEGFSRVVTRELDHGRGNPPVTDGPLAEFIANGSSPGRKGAPFTLFDSPHESLRLPVEEPPAMPWEQNPALWRGPHQFPFGSSGLPDDAFDDTPSLQAAIDSGATTIYLPRGTWRIRGDLHLRGEVRHVLGCEARLSPVDDSTAHVVLGDGSASAVLIEGLEAGGIRFTHRSRRTLHLRHLLGGRYVAPADAPAGNLFLTDVTLGPLRIAGNQSAWARQLNIEGDTLHDPEAIAKIENPGGTLWILGLKTEDAGTVVHTSRSGRTELLGHCHVGHSGAAPCFVTIDSSLSAALTDAPAFEIAALETRGGETRQSGDFRQADLYCAYPH